MNPPVRLATVYFVAFSRNFTTASLSCTMATRKAPNTIPTASESIIFIFKAPASAKATGNRVRRCNTSLQKFRPIVIGDDGNPGSAAPPVFPDCAALHPDYAVSMDCRSSQAMTADESISPKAAITGFHLNRRNEFDSAIHN